MAQDQEATAAEDIETGEIRDTRTKDNQTETLCRKNTTNKTDIKTKTTATTKHQDATVAASHLGNLHTDVHLVQ